MHTSIQTISKKVMIYCDKHSVTYTHGKSQVLIALFFMV